MQNQGASINPSVAQPTSGKSGCGCCGCLSGCLFMLMLPFVILAVLYFTVDMGKMADSGINWWYRDVVRARVLEPSLPASLTPQQKQEALQMADQVVDDYMNLPESEKKLIRSEVLTYIYYDVQNKKPSPTEIMHLTAFIEGQKRKLQNNPIYPLLDSKNPSSWNPNKKMGM